MAINMSSFPVRYNATPPTSPSTSPAPEDFPVIRGMFALVSVVAFFGNLFVVVVILKHRTLLQKSHYAFIFLWSIVDLLTAVLIPVSPGFIIAKHSYPYPPAGVGAQVFCRLIDTDYFLFAFGKASLLSAACMAVDRWYAVTKPLFYQRAFNRKKLGIYLASICCFSTLLPLYKPIVYFYKENPSTGEYRCSSNGLKGNADKIWRLVYTTITVILPCLITWFAFIHIWRRTRQLSALAHNARRDLIREKLLHLASVTAILMTLCWLPTEIDYMFHPFKVFPRCDICFKATKVLAFANSAINPFLYCVFNSVYRREMAKMLSYIKCSNFSWNPRPNRHEHYELSDMYGSSVNHAMSENLTGFTNVALVSNQRFETVIKIDKVAD